jgi:ParB family chromosome partitioning protein
MERKALGKGLAALIAEKEVPLKPNSADYTEDIQHPAALVTQAKKDTEDIIYIEVDRIPPNPYQPRQNLDPQAIEELATSIKEKGLIQPILVRRKGKNAFELIAGERRLRAAKLLKLKKIPAMVKDVKDEESLELSLIENIQRKDLNSIEEASAYQLLVERFGLTQDKISQVVGKARASITNILRLLRLPQDIQEEIRKDRLSFGHARALLELEDPDEQRYLARKAISNELSVREIENLIRQKRGEFKKKTLKKIKEREPYLVSLEENLQHVLGTKVKIIQHNKRGQIQIEFYSSEDLERIIKLIKR